MATKPPPETPQQPFDFRATFISLYQVHKRYKIPRDQVYRAAKLGTLRTHPQLGMTTEALVMDWLGLSPSLNPE